VSSLHLVSTVTIALRAASIPRPRLPGSSDRDEVGSAATMTLDPEVVFAGADEGNGEVPDEDRPKLTVRTLGPEDDSGGPTSYYNGEVTGITQVLQVMHNAAAGKKLAEGLEDLPRDQRLFDIEE
jgi:hypothetical protein